MIGRRGFLGALLGAAVLDPERLLWVPGKRMISIPAPVIKTARFQYVLEFSRWGPMLSGNVTRTDWIQHVYGDSGWDAEVKTISTMEISPGMYVDRVLVTLSGMPSVNLFTNNANCLSVGPPGNWRLGPAPDYKMTYTAPDEKYSYSLSAELPNKTITSRVQWPTKS
jgi:hypothetical protein